jgi:hypothetical protein
MIPQIQSPAYKIRKGYTDGNEYIIRGTNTEYIGFYHIYPNGGIFSGDTYRTDSVELLRLSAPFFKNPDNLKYYNIKKLKFDKHIDPVFVLPQPTANDYKNGFLKRFIAQKINEPDQILEISKDQASKANNSNKPGIDLRVWNVVALEWSISGPMDAVRKANDRVLSYTERRMPGIVLYLSNSLEFYK